MIQDGAAAFTGEVPVGVIGEVQHRIGIGMSLIVDRQLVLFSQCVDDFYLEIAGIAFLSIDTGVGQSDR